MFSRRIRPFVSLPCARRVVGGRAGGEGCWSEGDSPRSGSGAAEAAAGAEKEEGGGGDGEEEEEEDEEEMGCSRNTMRAQRRTCGAFCQRTAVSYHTENVADDQDSSLHRSHTLIYRAQTSVSGPIHTHMLFRQRSAGPVAFVCL